MAACDQGGEHVINHKVLANHGLAQFHAQRLGLLAGMLKVFGGQGGGQWRVAHKAFLRVCRHATCRLKSALESRFSATGSNAWLMI